MYISIVEGGSPCVSEMEKKEHDGICDSVAQSAQQETFTGHKLQ